MIWQNGPSRLLRRPNNTFKTLQYVWVAYTYMNTYVHVYVWFINDYNTIYSTMEHDGNVTGLTV